MKTSFRKPNASEAVRNPQIGIMDSGLASAASASLADVNLTLIAPYG